MSRVLAVVITAAALASVAGAAAVELEPVKVARVFTDIETDTPFGFGIQLPRGAELKDKSNAGYVYYKPFNAMIGFQIKVLPIGSGACSSADKATEYVRMMAAGSEWAETRKDAAGFTVVLKPMGIGQELWTFRNGKGVHAFATCSGPTSELKTLEAICASLQIVP